MQGISGCSRSLLLQALNNAADGSLRLALRVEIHEKNRLHSFYLLGKNIHGQKSNKPFVVTRIRGFSLICMQDSGITYLKNMDQGPCAFLRQRYSGVFE